MNIEHVVSQIAILFDNSITAVEVEDNIITLETNEKRFQIVVEEA